MGADTRTTCSTWRASIGAAVVAVLASAGLSSAAQAPAGAVVSPANPGSKPNAFHASTDALSAHGFMEQEFFVAGSVEGRITRDGPTVNRPYKTRFLVRRPLDPKRFNGTVVVEWLNTALGYDLELGWPMFGDLIMRDGYAWVGISALPAGIEYLKQWDPQRYGSLTHPAATPSAGERPVTAATENYSDAMFAQMAAVLRSPGGVGAFGGSTPQKLLAFGSAGSAIRLKPFINNLAVGKSPYDGYFVHATAGRGKLRETLDVPVFYLNSEWEIPAFVAIRQPDSKFFRYWEVPGSSHIARLSEDTLISESRRDQGDVWSRRCDVGQAVVSIEYASRAALHHLNAWVRTGQQPPHAQLARVDPTTNLPTMVGDRHGNTLGGVRLPHLEAPTGRHLGEGTPRENRVCSFTGGYLPFDAATLASLYPTHTAYVSSVKAAVQRAVKAGHLLAADAQAIRAEADRSLVGNGTPH